VNEKIRNLASVQRTSAGELATTEIRRCILSGDLVPGGSFSVADLAGQLGVSHIPVREALRKLETEGLVVLNRGRSASIAPLTAADVQGIYGLRLLIEPELAAASVDRHEPAAIERLRRLLREIDDPSPQNALRAERDFHVVLVRPGASEWDLRTLDQLHAAALRYSWLLFDPASVSGNDRTHCVRVHDRLLGAVVARDAAAVRSGMQEHLQETEAGLVERLNAIRSMETVAVAAK
jgi:DNA-binding GntR family transcriptional regulator